MGWDGVPWMIEGGAQHSAQTARLLAYLLLGGQEGVLGATDLAVRALPTPGGAVRIAPGAAGILCRATGEAMQTYLGRVVSDDVVPITPTDASGPRSDLVIARVENPWLAGEPWQQPADPAAGPYIYTRVLQDVPPTARTLADVGEQYSAIPLARIDIPPSTATITQDMIVDLRTVVNPVTGIGGPAGGIVAEREWSNSYDSTGQDGHGGDGTADLLPPGGNLTQWHRWPEAASAQVPVPTWATHLSYLIVVANPIQFVGPCWGQATLVIDGRRSDPVIWHYGSAGLPQRRHMIITGKMAVPAASRGRVVEAHLECNHYPAPDQTGELWADWATSTYMSFTFQQRAVYA